MIPPIPGSIIIMGLISMILIIILGPIAFLYGLAWLLEPRVGDGIYVAAHVISTLWAIGVIGFFGSAWWPWRRP